MNRKANITGVLCLALLGMFPISGLAQSGEKFTFILFWREDNRATQAMAATLRQSLSQRAQQAEWTAINVTDPANQSVVERYKVSRAPMPMVLCVAANGAVTAAITDQLTDQAIDQALVSPTMTHCMKALQDGRLVLVHVAGNLQAPLPQGAQDFAADPSFQARTITVSLRRDDPAEAQFVSDMKLETGPNGTAMVLLAPPAVVVGRFPASATKEDIAYELHKAGQCCNDPNCKHNKKGK